MRFGVIPKDLCKNSSEFLSFFRKSYDMILKKYGFQLIEKKPGESSFFNDWWIFKSDKLFLLVEIDRGYYDVLITDSRSKEWEAVRSLVFFINKRWLSRDFIENESGLEIFLNAFDRNYERIVEIISNDDLRREVKAEGIAVIKADIEERQREAKLATPDNESK